MPMPRRSFLKALDRPQESVCRIDVCDILQDIGLGPNQFIGFCQVNGTSLPDQLACNPSRSWITGNPGEGISAATLKCQSKTGLGNRRTVHATPGLQPVLDLRGAFFQESLDSLVGAQESMRHLVNRIAVLVKKLLQ